MPFDLQDMLKRTRDLHIAYFGAEINLEYAVERITHEFREDVLRLGRQTFRSEQELKVLTAQVAATEAALGSTDAEIEDARASQAIQDIKKLDERLKRDIDAALASVIVRWDMTNGGAPFPPTAENLYHVDSALEAAIMQAILNDARPLGEANGQQNMKLLPSTLRQKARQGTSRHRRTG